MAIATEISAALFTNIVASTPLNCNFPLYEADEVEVVYGTQAFIAVYPTDYTVQLNEAEDFEDFTITPTAALLTKINDLIADPPTEETETNFVVVRRKLDYLTSVQPETVRYTPFLSKEIDRIHMKLIQLAEKVARTLGLPANVVGDLDTEYTISAPVEGKAPVWRGNKLVAEIDAANIAGAEGFAAAAAASASDAQDRADDSLSYAVDSANSAAAAQAAAAGIRWREPVRAATTGALPACTYANGAAGVGATLTGNANGALVAQDGVTLVAGNRFLVKDQVASLQNGVYTVTQVGTAGTPFVLTRTTDADNWNELVSQVVIAEEGTVQKDLAYICTVDQGGVIGTNIVTWASLNPPLADNAVTTSKIADGNVTFVKIAAAAIASVAEMVSGAASKLLSAANFKTFVDQYQPRKVLSFVPAGGSTDIVIGYTFRAGYNYKIQLDNLQVGTDNTVLQLFMSNDDGASYVNSASAYTARRIYGTTGVVGDTSTSTVVNMTGYGMNANDPLCGTLRLFDPNNANKNPMGLFDYMMTEPTGLPAHGHTGIRRNANMACNKIKLTSSTNFSNVGRITVYEEPAT